MRVVQNEWWSPVTDAPRCMTTTDDGRTDDERPSVAFVSSSLTATTTW